MLIEQFYDYLRQREGVRLARIAGLAWPWTHDPIMQKYKFTNVRRYHDRTSNELIYHYDHHKGETYEYTILLNCAIARYFGTSEFKKAVGWFSEFGAPERRRLIRTAKERLKKGERVFTGAYIITNGGCHGSKVDVVVDHYILDLWANRRKIIDTVKSTSNWAATAKVLSEVEGFGGSGFMGKEVILDTMYFDMFWPTQNRDGSPIRSIPNDYQEWTPLGPGSIRGLVRIIFELSPKKNPHLRTRVGLADLLQIHAEQKKYWPKLWGVLSPTDIQFGCCEFDKRERVRLGEGTPRSLYHHEEIAA